MLLGEAELSGVIGCDTVFRGDEVRLEHQLNRYHRISQEMVKFLFHHSVVGDAIKW